MQRYVEPFPNYNVHYDHCCALFRVKHWKAEVLPIASHQCGAWLETEYNTAVLRARQTAQWQQFFDEKDVLPNLKWLPSTYPNPGADHRLYWNTILPIDHPFWDQHRPGDRWNCKCSLTSTDEPSTPVPGDSAPVPGDLSSGNTPHPGLTGNPAKTRAIFSQDHPYFLKDCNHCAFYKPNIKSRLRSLFKAQTKDCYHCPYIDGCISRISENGFKLKNNFENGGKLYIHPDVDKDKSDYKDMLRICTQFAKMGHEVKMTPRVHRKSDDYQRIYGSLIGTKYENKCPDFSIDGVFYEYEGFKEQWSKKKVGRMLSHGMKQSSHIVIKNKKGCSHRFTRSQIMARLNNSYNAIKEVWIYEHGTIVPILVNGQFIK